LRRGLDENEAAVYLSLSPSFVRRLVADKLMPRPRVAGGEGEVLFTADDGDSWADFT
jgi:excisionase family DNA binding protein